MMSLECCHTPTLSIFFLFVFGFILLQTSKWWQRQPSAAGYRVMFSQSQQSQQQKSALSLSKFVPKKDCDYPFLVPPHGQSLLPQVCSIQLGLHHFFNSKVVRVVVSVEMYAWWRGGMKLAPSEPQNMESSQENREEMFAGQKKDCNYDNSLLVLKWPVMLYLLLIKIILDSQYALMFQILKLWNHL